MDAARFDTIVQSLAGPTRRSLLGIVLGGLAGGGVHFHEGDAKKKRKKRKGNKKKKSQQPQDGTNNECPEGAGTCDTTCARRCEGRVCGDDGCGGTCGSCGGTDICQGGQCVCQPACGGKMCGDDGCGGSCGACLAGSETCSQSQCVCSTSGGLGPGELCSSAGQCCPYTGEEVCNRGEGSCQSFLSVCRSGFGGRCAGSCDCRGDLTCQDGTCRCPGSRPYIGDGLCCAEGLRQCGNRCCLSSQQCLCPPLGQCLCIT